MSAALVRSARFEPRSERTRDLRAALLDAARALLGEHGGSRFSLATTATRAGCNPALVSYYFGGKDQMLMAILDEDAEAVMGPLAELRAADLPAIAKLERHVAGLVELSAKRSYLGALTHELLRRGDFATRERVTAQIVQPVIAFQAALLEQGTIEGAFRRVDPLGFYFLVLGAVDMLFSARATLELGFGLHADDQDVRRRFVHEVLAVVLVGVRVSPTHPCLS